MPHTPNLKRWDIVSLYAGEINQHQITSKLEILLSTMTIIIIYKRKEMTVSCSLYTSSTRKISLCNETGNFKKSVSRYRRVCSNQPIKNSICITWVIIWKLSKLVSFQ